MTYTRALQATAAVESGVIMTQLLRVVLLLRSF